MSKPHVNVGTFGRTLKPIAQAVLAAARGSETAEQWWTKHATLLAEKMKRGGVQSFRIELTPKGTYEFEVTPTASPNEKGQP